VCVTTGYIIYIGGGAETGQLLRVSGVSLSSLFRLFQKEGGRRQKRRRWHSCDIFLIEAGAFHNLSTKWNCKCA